MTRLNEGGKIGRRNLEPKSSRLVPQCFCILGILLIHLSYLALPVCTEAATNSREYQSSDVPKDIPGRGTEVSTLTIADTDPIVDLNVKVNITHPYNADLDVFLIAPDGTRVELFTDVGGTSANFEDTILDDEATESIANGDGPFAGSYRPEGSLAVLKTKDIAGIWTLEVTDDWSASRAGTLNSWSLIIETEVLEPLPAPVIHVEQSVPGGTYDTVYWEDGTTKQYKEYESRVEVRVPDGGTTTSILVIEDFGMIADLNVKLDILHGRDSDLDVFLIAPDKTRVELFTDVGGMGYHFTDTVLDDDATVSIAEGSAPFTGTYRPEGKLSDLIGKEICGTWTLEVTDDSTGAVGTLSHWSVSVVVADTLYYVECATDADFATIIADSGWVSGNSYTFSGLAPDQKHWFRVKARPMETWCQTSQSDFAADTLSHTQTTSGGDVILAGGTGDGPGPQVFAIKDPSFETLSGWYGWNTNPNVFIGRIKGYWATDGEWAGCVLYFYESSHNKGDYGYIWQNVNWTDVGTLKFDYASLFFGSLLKASVLIGNVEVWSANGTDGFVTAHRDVTIDVSAFKGNQPLVLKAEALVSGRFDCGILFDNLRTYGIVGHDPSGTVVSTAISIGNDDTWDLLRFNSTAPTGTTLTVDVLPATGDVPIDPWRSIPSAGDGVMGMGLGDLTNRSIRLRANLSTSNRSVTPALHDWSLTYSNAARQSPWSNVVTGLPREGYGGGAGTVRDPYQIWTAEQMNAIGANPWDWDKHFRLMADIDLGAFSGARGATFTMIGRDASPFSGIFDGNSRTISNFTMADSDATSRGLFGAVQGSNAVIKNLTLTAVSVNAGARGNVGALVGHLYSGSISGCHVEGGSVSGGSCVGGLVGICGGTIVNCSSSASVSTSDISGGGLIGYGDRTSTITACCATGQVSGRSNAGGLIGENHGTINNCYSRGQVSATKGGAGGLVAFEYGTIRNCYSSGRVSAPIFFGGLVGSSGGASITNSFWDRQTSGQATSAGGTGKTTAEMKRAATFTGWDFQNVWTIREGIDYPTLRWTEPSGPPPPAQAIIASVVRANGESDNQAPIGRYNGNTQVLPTQAGGLKDGNLCFSDRTYPWADTPAQLVGAEYVRTFNSDKKSTMVTYTVTTSKEATVMITVDNRISDRQGAVNQATARFASAGTFVDTRRRLYIREDAATDRMQSIFSARLPAGTYVFGPMPSVNNFYVIGAMD